jgi:preprotein translocase subunit Sec61beta
MAENRKVCGHTSLHSPYLRSQAASGLVRTWMEEEKRAIDPRSNVGGKR